jgi:prophage regulatory protein
MRVTTFLKLADVLERTKLSRSNLYNLMDQGRFPKPAKLGDRVNAWADHEIQAWIEAQLAER